MRDADLKPTPIGTGLINNAILRHWEFYAGDIWKLRPNLTVSYGLRYQWHTPPIDEFGRQTLLAYKDSGELIDPQDYLKRKAAAAANGDIFNPDIAYLPINKAPQDGVFRINRKDFSPRVSAAWEPQFKSGVSGSGGVGTSGNPANKGSGLSLFSNPEQVSKSFRPIQLAADGRHGRGVLRGLPRWQFDLSVGKTTTIYERVRFGLQFDFFNVFNKVNFADPTLDLRSPSTFGVITSQFIAVGFRPRVIQIGARVDF